MVLERADRWHLAKMAPGFLCLAMQIHLKFELLAPHEHNLKEEELVSLKKKKQIMKLCLAYLDARMTGEKPIRMTEWKILNKLRPTSKVSN